MKWATGDWIGSSEVGKLATEHNFQIRTGVVYVCVLCVYVKGKLCSIVCRTWWMVESYVILKALLGVLVTMYRTYPRTCRVSTVVSTVVSYTHVCLTEATLCCLICIAIICTRPWQRITLS